MRTLGNELRKMLSNRFLLMACAAFLIINGFHCWKEIQWEWKGLPTDNHAAAAQLYDTFEGRLEPEKLQQVVEEYNRLSEIIRRGQYSTQPNQSGTYTGYVYNDWQMFEALYAGLDYAYHYAGQIEIVVQKAKNNISFYQERQNTYEAARNSKIASHYQGRVITSYFRTDGWESYFMYSFSSLCTIFLVVFGTASLFCRDRELGMDSLLNVCRFGRWRVFTAKTGLALLFTLVVTTLFFLEDWALYAVRFAFCGYTNPIYSLPFMQYSPYSCSIGTYLLLSFGWKFLGALTVCMLSLFSSALFSHELAAFIGALALLLPGIVLKGGSVGSWVTLFELAGTLTTMKTVSIFGLAVRQDLLLTVTNTVFVLFLLFLCGFLETHRNACTKRGIPL